MGMMRRVVSVVLMVLLGTSIARAQHGRPVILLVHGRGMLDRDTALARKLWLNSLRNGAALITKSRLLEDGDVRLVWYADVLDPASNAACDYSSGDPRAMHSAAGDDGLKTIASMAGGLFGTLARLVDDQEMATQMRELAGDAAFFGDSRKRCATEDRLASAIARARSEGRPVIIAAHSLGSLVAYDYLSAQQDTGVVRTLATLGSPLGSTDLRRLMTGADSVDTLAKPVSVGEWVNIRNVGDMFATSIAVAREIAPSPPSDEPDPHELAGYLRERETASELLGAWCRAFNSSAPAGCAEIRK
jgi:pimeloyl-ACP methyl ester carboxylesterase